MNTRDNDPPLEGGDVHARAEAILAERNRIRGGAPGDYTAEEYLAAIQEAQREQPVQAALRSGDDENALKDLGYAPLGGRHRRLARGASRGDPGRTGPRPRRHEPRELRGVPSGASDRARGSRAPPARRARGQGRAREGGGDPGERDQDRRRARGGGTPRNQLRGLLQELAWTDTETAIRILSALKDDARSPVFRDPEMRRVAASFTSRHARVRPDAESVRLHLEVEARLQAEGKADRRGNLVYDEDDYARVLDEIALEEKLRAAAEAESEAE